MVQCECDVLATSHTVCTKKRTLQDIYSYNFEQSHNETHNLVNVLMTHDGLSLQQAVDRTGEMCKQCIDTFIENQKRIPSWGDSVDRDVKLYVRGLQEWMPGSLQWSFMTKRYFGDNGGTVKATRIVDLLPRKA
jgi:alpha-muurolene/germacrene-A/gamma-muurolene synthase